MTKTMAVIMSAGAALRVWSEPNSLWAVLMGVAAGLWICEAVCEAKRKGD